MTSKSSTTNRASEEKALPAHVRRGKKMLVNVVIFAFVLLGCVLLKLNLFEPAFDPYIAIITVYAILLGVWTTSENRELGELRKR